MIIVYSLFAGTTDFYSSIIKHPLIVPTVVKESNFWFRSMDNGVTFRDYVELYDPVAETIRHNKDMITLDASPENVFLWNHTKHRTTTPPLDPRFTAREIRALHPYTKIIIMLRNPVTWLYSLYRHVKGGSGSPRDFHQCVQGKIANLQRCLSDNKGNIRQCAMIRMKRDACNVHHSIYYIYIQEWLKVFPRKQLLIIKAEEYYSNREAVMTDVFKFLDVPALNDTTMEAVKKHKVLNTGNKIQPMLNETRYLLNEFTDIYNKELAKLLDDPKFTWKK